MDSVIKYLRDHRETHLEWVRDLCRIPSISTKAEHRDDLRKAAGWVRNICEQSGLTASVHETGGHPLVYAEHCQAAVAPTFLVYGHFDVQPEGDLSLWDADPFDPVVKDGRLICRGSADDKGQLLLYIRAAAAWLATEKRLPINLKLLLEGEEEISSPNLGDFLRENTDLLRNDHILISDTGMFAEGYPTITYGTRGLLYKEIRLHGPKHDLHSGSFGGTIANPVNILTQIVASLHDADGRVTIPGFYEDVLEISGAERKQFQSLPFDEELYLSDTGAPALSGEKGFSTNERRWARPTLDANGIYGGFMGEGANTIVPKMAGAKVSMRLVPNQSGDKLSVAFDEAIRARCPESVRLEIIDHGRADAYMAPLDGRAMDAGQQALREAFEQEPALVREGGSLPILAMFKQVLQSDCLLMGFAGPNCNAHGPNENISIADLDRGAEAVARLYQYLAS